MTEPTDERPLGQNPGEVEQGRDGGLRGDDMLGTDNDIADLEAEVDADENADGDDE